MGVDYYGCLGLKHAAAQEDVVNSYRMLSLKYHPSKNADPGAKAKFELVTEAFQVLSNLKTKAFYDQYGEEGIKRGFVAPGGVKKGGFYRYIGDSIETFLHFFGTDNPFQADLDLSLKFQNLNGKADLQKDSQVYKSVQCSLEDLYVGKDIQIPHSRQIVRVDGTVSRVSETLHIKITPGLGSGTAFHFPCKGDERFGHEPADIIYKVIEEQHPIFQRMGNDLCCRVSIALVDALCGSTIQVKTLDNRTLDIPMFDIVKDGSEKVVVGEGMPSADGVSRGDLRVKVDILYPKSLNSTQKRVIMCALNPKSDFANDTLTELCDVICSMIPPSRWAALKQACFVKESHDDE